MPRPKTPRCIRFSPSVFYYKPQGIPMRDLDEVIIGADEFEALRLHDVLRLDQTESARKMLISQPTLARLLDSANKKIADALVNGKAIRIEKNEK